MAPIISAIMSAYNAEKFIDKSIESVLNQTFQNFELIIINDKSIHQTQNIIKKFYRRNSCNFSNPDIFNCILDIDYPIKKKI